MPPSKREREMLRAYCAALHPDDGIGPKEDKKIKFDRSENRNRKLQQLCKQVGNALRLSIASVDGLAEAVIVDVAPAPDAARLRVIIAVAGDSEARTQCAQRFEQCTGHLRNEVARAISRRRTPELLFSIQPQESQNERNSTD